MFAIAFVIKGIGRVDPVAEHAPLGFRLIVMPGVIALWPLLLVRWMRECTLMIQPLRRAHFRIWVVLPLLLFALLAAGLYVRRTTTPVNPALDWERNR